MVEKIIRRTCIINRTYEFNTVFEVIGFMVGEEFC